MESQLTVLRHTLTSLNILPSISGMAWHPALEKPVHQVSNPTLILLGSIPFFSTPPDSIFQQLAMESLNGSCHSVTAPSCQKQLNPTSQVFIPSTLMQDYLSNVVSPLQSSTSLGASSVSMGKRLAPQSYWSHSPSYRSLLQCLEILASETTSTSIKLAWAGFLQCGEFMVPNGQRFDSTVYLTRNAVEFIPSIEEPAYVHLTLPSSRTDPFCKGVL